MSEATEKLLNLINEGKTCNEISSILGITNKQLYNNLTNLRNKGLIYQRSYFSDGNIMYRPVKGIRDLNNYYNSNKNTIFTNTSENSVQALVISDLHFGNNLERMDLVDRAYNYCIKNDIHLIFCCGDIIDGTYGRGEKDIDNIYDQIEYFIKNYPFDKNILTFGVGGDHDSSSLYIGGQNFLEAVKNYRHDVIIPAYNNAFINLKNDEIHLYHYHDCGKKFITHGSVILSGHCHKYSSFLARGVLNVSVPTLSSLTNSLPTAILMNLNFENGLIKFVNLKQIYFAPNECDYVLSEINYNLPEREIIKSNDEEMIPTNLSCETELISEEADKTKTLSQVDKFHKRWNM